MSFRFSMFQAGKRRQSLFALAAVTAVGIFTIGCASSWAPPNERMANAESAVRGAQEVGATNEPNAALHLKIAQEEIVNAKALMKNDDNKRADFVLMRASAEAELALSLSKASIARAEAQKTIDEVAKLKAAN